MSQETNTVFEADRFSPIGYGFLFDIWATNEENAKMLDEYMSEGGEWEESKDIISAKRIVDMIQAGQINFKRSLTKEETDELFRILSEEDDEQKAVAYENQCTSDYMHVFKPVLDGQNPFYAKKDKVESKLPPLECPVCGSELSHTRVDDGTKIHNISKDGKVVEAVNTSEGYSMVYCQQNVDHEIPEEIQTRVFDLVE